MSDSVNGTDVAFLSSIVSLAFISPIISYFFSTQQFYGYPTSIYLIIITIIIMLRFYLKVVFIDNYINKVSKSTKRHILIILIFISALSGSVWNFFVTSKMGSIFMLAYCLLFLLVTTLLHVQIYKNNLIDKKSRIDNGLSFFVEICFIIFWGYVALSQFFPSIAYSSYTDKNDSSLIIIVIICFVAVTHEFNKVYSEPLKNRIESIQKKLF